MIRYKREREREKDRDREKERERERETGLDSFHLLTRGYKGEELKKKKKKKKKKKIIAWSAYVTTGCLKPRLPNFLLTNV
jgi:hypothetical protein